MGAFDFLFKKPKVKQEVSSYFKMLDGYSPVFTTYDGGLYEMELVRACIHAFATHCSKMLPEVSGADTRGVKAMLDGKPNPFMTSAQFIYKVATIYEAKNTCFIVPMLDKFDRLIGYYPVNPQKTEVIEVAGEPWLRFTFAENKKVAFELARVGAVSKYLYNSDIKGESNDALQSTLDLIHTQNQGITEGIKNSASFRFMGILTNFAKTEDRKKLRDEVVKNSLSNDSGGFALFPSGMTVQQIQSQAKIVDPEQMNIIQTRVLNYFGCNEEVLQNKTVGDAWAAYYEGKIEPFAIQLSQAMTCMTFSHNERARGNAVVWTANRLQYMTNADKLQVSSQMFDRGIMSVNDIMSIWQLPKVADGDKRYIRKEYAEVSKLNEGDDPAQIQEEENNDTEHEDKAQE